MDRNLRRDIILTHYENPYHKGLVEDIEHEYVKNNTNSVSCIDNVDIMYKIKDGVIQDIYFDGEACAISTSSTSIMIRNLIGKTIQEAKEYIENFEHMIQEMDYNEDLLKEALAYNELYIKSLEKHIVSMPNAFEMISFLWNHYLLYIATDGPKQAVPSKLNAIGCSSFFQGIFSRNMTKSNTAKPNPLFFEDLLEYIHFDKKDRILIVGDNLEKDIALASNVQVDSCWYNHKQEVSTTIIPTYEIHDLLELKRILS